MEDKPRRHRVNSDLGDFQAVSMTSPANKSAMKHSKNTRRVRISSPTPADEKYHYPSPVHSDPPVVSHDKDREALKKSEAPPVVENTATYPPYNSTTSVTAGPNPIFTHTTQPVGLPPGFVQANFPGQPYPSPHFAGAQPPSFPTTTNLTPGFFLAPTHTQSIPASAPATMAANYQNAFPYNYGVHFQPQVPDTSAGAMVHTYVPRFDNAPGVVAVAGQPQPGILVGPRSYFHDTYQVIQPVYLNTQPAVAPLYCSNYYANPSYFIPLGFKGDKHNVAPYYGPANTVQYQNGVPFAPAVGPTVPLVNQQPAYQPAQIMMANGSTPVMSAPIQGIPPMMGGAPPLIVGGQPQFMPGTMTPDSTHFEPATGIGLTGMEVAADQAQNPELCEPQDFKPASDDPSRMYWVRQCDGCWTALSRAAIDGVGDCRWYVMPNGVFYAVRLPS